MKTDYSQIFTQCCGDQIALRLKKGRLVYLLTNGDYYCGLKCIKKERGICYAIEKRIRGKKGR